MKYKLFLLSLSLVLAGLLCAQPPDGLPGAVVGVPFSLDFGQGLDEIPPIADVQFTYSFTVSSGSLPPGLSLSPSGLLSGTPTTAGNYTFGITFTFQIIFDGQNFGQSVPFNFGLVVSGGSGAKVTVDPATLSFPLNQGSATAITKVLRVSNLSNQAQTFTASAQASNGGSFITASGGGSIGAFSSSSISVTVNPGNLVPGTYTGTVSVIVSSSNQTFSIPILVTVTSAQQQLQLSASGLRFQAVSGAGAPPSQSITVLNGGSGSLDFAAKATTISGGSWLSVSPTSGRADQISSPVVTVSVNPSGLAAGDYYGQVTFTASGVANSPQTASIVLNVAASGTTIDATVKPTGVIFVGTAGGTNPASKSITITNPNSTPLSFNTATFFGQSNSWFTVSPPGGSVTPAAPVQLTLQPNITGLTAGVYQGEVVIHFVEDNSTQHIAVLLVLLRPGSTTGIKAESTTTASNCTPTKLLPVFTQQGNGFTAVAAWPTPVEVTVVDDCGIPLVSGSVGTSFSSGDPALALTSLKDGRWSGTWQPRAASTQVTITSLAQEFTPPLQGTQMIGGALASNPVTPVINAGGAVSAASLTANQPLAPGAFMAIFGTHLSSGTNISPTLPFSMQLGGTQAVLAGRQLPLYFAADGQINAVIPYDVPVNSTQQLVVTNGPALSQPEPVVIAPAQPAMFTVSQTGNGPGVFVGVHPDGTQFLVDANHPVTAGDAVVIYCAGLGTVTPSISAGSAASLTTFSYTDQTVTVTIGGQPVQGLFSGLAPGFAGLYQVNVLMPTGITPGSSVPVVITAGGISSSPVTITVK